MDLVESAITDQSDHRHPWELARSRVVLDLIQKNIDKKAEILDIGCGDSWLIETLSKDLQNAKFTAVDTAFNNQLLEQYRGKLDQTIFSFSATLEEGLNNKGVIDLVLLLDVIEHIEDDIHFLKDLVSKKESITRDTRILITVPAFQSLYCAHDDFLGHYRRYSNKSLINHLNEAGLEVEKHGYFFSSLVLPRFLIKILESSGLKSKKVKGIGNHKAGTMDAIIKNTLIFDYRLGSMLRKLGLNLAGLSNFAIARPKQ